jgi:signal peptidase I
MSKENAVSKTDQDPENADKPGDAAEPKDNRTFRQVVWQEWIKPIVPVIIVVLAAKSSLADWNDVPTGSMKPTIMEGDRIFVNKLAYDLKVPFVGWRLWEFDGPTRGEIAVFFDPEDGIRMVKRVIGTPGDTIALVNNRLHVNGVPMEYDDLETDHARWLMSSELDHHQVMSEQLGEVNHALMIKPGAGYKSTFDPITVPEGQYYMMGDNRDNSRDSRWYGFVDRRLIAGQATRVVLSFEGNDWFSPQWNRFFRSLD